MWQVYIIWLLKNSQYLKDMTPSKIRLILRAKGAASRALIDDVDECSFDFQVKS